MPDAVLDIHFNPQNNCRVNKIPIFTDKQIEVQSHSIRDLWEMVVQRFKPEWKAKILVSFMVLHAHPLPTPYVLDLIISTASASSNPASCSYVGAFAPAVPSAWKPFPHI